MTSDYRGDILLDTHRIHEIPDIVPVYVGILIGEGYWSAEQISLLNMEDLINFGFAFDDAQSTIDNAFDLVSNGDEDVLQKDWIALKNEVSNRHQLLTNDLNSITQRMGVIFGFSTLLLIQVLFFNEEQGHLMMFAGCMLFMSTVFGLAGLADRLFRGNPVGGSIDDIFTYYIETCGKTENYIYDKTVESVLDIEERIKSLKWMAISQLITLFIGMAIVITEMT
jgi:hypothetical protein